jgi:ribosomal-protein-alanine N-acetyltransferase
MTIEQARPGDLMAIMALERTGFTQQRWSATAWAEEIAHPSHTVFVARQDPATIFGVSTWSTVAGTAELLRIVVAPPWRRLGWGARLLKAGLDWAARNRAQSVFLEVAESNLAASQLYRAAGFEVIDRRRNYYGPGQDALVMNRPLDPPYPFKGAA